MKSSLTKSRNYYKPFSYPWAYDAFMASEQMHWLWTEVPMIEDIKDWKNVLTDGERDFLTKVFRFFTQGDIDVSSAYVNTYLPFFPTPEIRMMLSSFAAREAVLPRSLFSFDRDDRYAGNCLQRVKKCTK